MHYDALFISGFFFRKIISEFSSQGPKKTMIDETCFKFDGPKSHRVLEARVLKMAALYDLQMTFQAR